MTSRTIIQSGAQVVNVASVPQRSPFRYPGGKTWLVPHVRTWLRSLHRRPAVFVEPFAGGAIVGLTVAAESLARDVVLGELDENVASVWATVLSDDCGWLIKQILGFEMNRENAIEALANEPRTCRQRAFATIIRNRVNRGGILAPGATLVKNGENGKGVASRWYPETLASRITAIAAMKDRIAFVQGDAFSLIHRYSKRATAAFFVDPPYTAGGKNAGSRLYSHNEVDHARLFSVLAKVRGPVMMTYDDAPEVRVMAERHGFQVEEVPMKNTHHSLMHELVISNIGSCLDLKPAEQVAAYLTRRISGGAAGLPPQSALFK